MSGPRPKLFGAPSFPNAACLPANSSVEAQRAAWDLFFGPGGERPREAAYREAEAKALCRTCPHLADCRTWAIGNPDAIGDTQAPFPNRTSATHVGQIIGGLSFPERHAIREGRPAPVRLAIVPREPAGNGRRGEIEHGTSPGYSAHLRRGEKPCDECKAARNKARRESQEWARRRERARQATA